MGQYEDSVARIAAGHEVTQAAQAERLKQRQQLAYEEPPTQEEQMEEFIKRMETDPAFAATVTSEQRIAVGHYQRRKAQEAKEQQT
jgi:hypothetical protein